MQKEIVIAILGILVALTVNTCTRSVGAQETPVIPEVVEYKTYIDTTDKPTTLGWDRSQYVETTGYEIKIWNFERDAFFAAGNVDQPPEGTDPSIVLSLPKTGHWVVFARTIAGEEMSEWSNTLDSEYVFEGVPFWIYRYLAPAGPIIIE